MHGQRRAASHGEHHPQLQQHLLAGQEWQWAVQELQQVVEVSTLGY
jgi:hypothetical protein